MKAKRYTIYVEEIAGSMPDIDQFASIYLECYTLNRVQGTWQGKPERSVKIENVCLEELLFETRRAAVHMLANQLKKCLHQEAVLVTEEDIEAEMV